MESQAAGNNGGGPDSPPDSAGPDTDFQAGQADQATSASAIPADRDANAIPAGRDNTPRWLKTGAGYAWRLMVLAVAIYLLARVLGTLYIVVVPCTAALLLTALLEPLAERLRKHGWGPLSSTWTALLVAIIIVAGMGVLITNRVQAEYPSLVIQVRHTSDQIESWLAGPPFHLRTANVESIFDNITKYLSQHRSAVEGTVVTGGRIAAEALVGLVLMFFVTFFLMKDGDRIWHWLTGGFRAQSKERVDRAGHAAWKALVYYIRGTVAVAAIQAVVMAITLAVINAPLVAPLALLIFVGAFIPIVGALATGAIALLVVLAANGLWPALAVLVVMVVMNQVESHLLQPQVVGKMLHLHPLAVILALAIGGEVDGIFGAMIAVPLTAAVSRAVAELRRPGPDSP